MSRSRVIGAAPQAVWDQLADFGSISSWAGNVDHSCLLEHSTGIGPGTSRRIQIGRNAVVERITDCQAPTTLGYVIEGLPARLGRMANRWELRPAGGGRTGVSVTSSVRMGDNPVARIAERLVCRAMAKQSEVMLAGLAHTVEES